MTDKKIVSNKQYQRSSKVWPVAARSFLIDSVLRGFPLPKFSLYQQTDLKTRRTIKEIVDGQQRSQAILDFFNDELRITTKGEFNGLTYSRLKPKQKQRYLDYTIAVDVFVDATVPDIRELFRRVNSYNVPLNHQEKRHSTFQGPFKWFIYEESRKYSQLLKDLGTFNESQIARMDDAKFLADFFVGTELGLITASEKEINDLYKQYDVAFPCADAYTRRLEDGFNRVIEFKDVLLSELTKKNQLYVLLLAFCHKLNPIESLTALAKSDGLGIQDRDATAYNLASLAEALSVGESENKDFVNFIENSIKTPDRQTQRKVRFQILFGLLQ